MPKWAKFTRQVESSMISETGTRALGLSTSTVSSRFGLSPTNWAQAAPGESHPVEASPVRRRCEHTQNEGNRDECGGSWHRLPWLNGLRLGLGEIVVAARPVVTPSGGRSPLAERDREGSWLAVLEAPQRDGELPF